MRNSNIRLVVTRPLRALAATVRLGTVTLAAEELNVTQAAVSHQLRELEEMIGQQLFRRNGRRLEPTPAAHILADAVQESARLLEDALEVIGRRPAANSLTVSMLPALASKWLAPQLTDMLKEYKAADLRISASRQFVDFRRDRIDAAIRYGLGRWPNVRSRHICDELIAPVMSPQRAATLNLTSPDVFAALPLLRSDNPDSWERWFESSGRELPPRTETVFFDDDAAMIEAAIGGAGVALGRSALVARDIRSGRLVAPFGHAITSRFSYWFVQDASILDNAAHLEFFDWIKAHLTQDAQVFDKSATSPT
ncbi:LysR substrate-binding domain-containing protein [Halomonas salipaludis]|uniref:Transcriptional regulator n=1 Tax=Halomonas salipaludis TaxID=2032625 RepID=A0A2A2ET26_9GAMM|nr:LysR substrate-binding domain-containing protein [Halomonas salipaludis]PAU75539.1 transcriptional regulator [Halomonas salipaludis]